MRILTLGAALVLAWASGGADSTATPPGGDDPVAARHEWQRRAGSAAKRQIRSEIAQGRPARDFDHAEVAARIRSEMTRLEATYGWSVQGEHAREGGAGGSGAAAVERHKALFSRIAALIVLDRIELDAFDEDWRRGGRGPEIPQQSDEAYEARWREAADRDLRGSLARLRLKRPRFLERDGRLEALVHSAVAAHADTYLERYVRAARKLPGLETTPPLELGTEVRRRIAAELLAQHRR